MKMEVKIEGMHCAHCSARVEAALNAIDGVKAKVSHKTGTAVLKSKDDISETAVKAAVTEAGYTFLDFKVL